MALELRGITKRFPTVVANDNVSLSVAPGEIVALLGENGAGKTTLMNVLFGLYSPDEGQVVIDGDHLELSNPSASIAAGVGMVHQHFMLVPVFTVAENVILGLEPVKGLSLIDRTKARRLVTDISDRYRLAVDPDALIEDLPVGVQQRVEIVKVLARDARYIVFDEPTAVLTPQEVEEFFEIVRGLKDDGKGVIFISHKLNEALEIADRIVVLRDGKAVGEVNPADTSKEQLAELMVGRPVLLTVEKSDAEPGDVVLSVENLVVLDDRAHRTVNGASFEVRSGEIVGIAGVQGNGQTELVESIVGMRPSLAGRVVIAGHDVTEHSPRQIHESGIAHVPEDRQESGLVLDFTVAENMVLDSYYDEPYSRGLRMDWATATEAAQRLVDEYDVKTTRVDVPVSTLSGGNQQKVIVAREFDRDVKLVIGSQPTRGVDVGSIEYIHARIVEQRDMGAAVLVISSELDEVMALADRILVIYQGRIVGEFDPKSVSSTEVGLAMLGSGEG
ncbi:MAG TPA: ABC transporter ATP-binding protein [Acidimicrobiia bacterium]|nr:ABC transporter ATP-binding protein [Acidimicrobiia bacterium]